MAGNPISLFSDRRRDLRWLAPVMMLAMTTVVTTSAIAQAPNSNSYQVPSYFGDSSSDVIESDSVASTSSPARASEAEASEDFDPSIHLVDWRDDVTPLQAQQASLHSQMGMPSAKIMNRGKSRWFTTFESVIVQPLQENTSALIVETDDGYGHVAFPWELEHSPRIQFGLETDGETLGWRVRYWQFRHTDAFLANDANGLIPAGNEGIVGYLSEDGDVTVGLDFVEEGRFASSIRADVIDFELQRHLHQAVDVYAGIRYGKIVQGYRADTDQGSAFARSSFRGVGPTLAMRLQQDLAWDRLSVFANVRGSLLFGHKELSFADDANGLPQSIGNDDFRLSGEGADTLASNGELQVGMRFVATQWLALTVAFEAQTYSDVGGPNPTAIFTGPDSGIAGGSPVDDSLSFAGITVGTEVTW